jgi:hypothetical protein
MSEAYICRVIRVIFGFLFFDLRLQIKSKAEWKFFLCLEICRQCRGKLDRELSEGPFITDKTTASATPITTPSGNYEKSQEATQDTETGRTVPVRLTLWLMQVAIAMFLGD